MTLIINFEPRSPCAVAVGGLGMRLNNPLTPRIRKLILLTDNHTNLCWLFLRIWCYIKTISLS